MGEEIVQFAHVAPNQYDILSCLECSCSFLYLVNLGQYILIINKNEI